MILSKILLFAYNRSDKLSRTLDSLASNLGAKDSDLIIFCDGAKTEKHIKNVENTRKIAKSAVGFKSCTVIERSENFGLSKSIISGVTNTLEICDRVIVLEDDLVTSPYFLQFMNDSLEAYKDNLNVVSISGYSLPFKNKISQDYFQLGADCWGWATWRRGWANFDNDGKKLLNELVQRNLTFKFDYDGTYPFSKMLMEQSYGLIDSWAIRWRASTFLKNLLTLYPAESFVQNIGLDGEGTHEIPSEPYKSKLSNIEYYFQKIEPLENKNAYIKICDFYENIPSTSHSILSPLYKKIRRRLGPIGEGLKLKIWKTQCERRINSK